MKVHMYLAIGQYFWRWKAEADIVGVFPTMDEAQEAVIPLYKDGTFERVAAYGYDVEVSPLSVLKAMFLNAFKVGRRDSVTVRGEATANGCD